MPTKESLIEKLCSKPYPKNFTKQELDSLMGKCNCKKQSAGRGSGIKYSKGNNKLVFDLPHPGKDLYKYQINLVKEFLTRIGEIKSETTDKKGEANK